jgi:hypothetical protein
MWDEMVNTRAGAARGGLGVSVCRRGDTKFIFFVQKDTLQLFKVRNKNIKRELIQHSIHFSSLQLH